MSYFTGQIDTENKEKGERCPGEEKCISTFGKPLFNYEERGLQIEDVCFGDSRRKPCPLHLTKPGSTPAYLVEWVDFALAKRTLSEGGASFAYPDTFTSREWIAIETLVNSNAASQVKERRRQEKQRERQAEEDRLRALVSNRRR
jgi:hypothetical protein